MSWKQWLILLLAIILVAVLYSLPRSVVDNEAGTAVIAEGQSEASHVFALPANIQVTIGNLRNSIIDTAFTEKSSIFADSLVGIYLSYNQLDSAAFYVDWKLQQDGDVDWAADRYFQLFGISANNETAKRFAGKADSLFGLIEGSSINPDIRAKRAMTKVISSNPMEGIMMLRQVLEEYPTNTTALYGLGVLSVQSGQFDKAVKRFEKLMTLDPANEQGAYYLAVSYFEVGEMAKASQWFQSIKEKSTDPAILNSTEEYLKKLNEL